MNNISIKQPIGSDGDTYWKHLCVTNDETSLELLKKILQHCEFEFQVDPVPMKAWDRSEL